MEIKQFTEAQFMDSVEPFEYAYQFNGNDLKLQMVLNELSKQAKKIGLQKFISLYRAYVKGLKKSKNYQLGNILEYTGCDKEYMTGRWIANDDGITSYTFDGVEETACSHPIYISERLTNIDTGLEKVKIEFSRSSRWKNVIVNKSIIAASSKIIELADKGIGVTSENARLLVQFLHDVESLNYADINEKKCVSRMGWIDGEGFAPYCDKLEFDGDGNLADIFSSITSKGDISKWREKIIEVCNYNYINKIIIGASLAAPLIKWLNINNFWLHLWSDTETAKTVSLMCAASIWGNPYVGRYIKTFNSTNVGKERIAEMCNNLPVFFDELQIVTDRKQFDREIYELCEGAGRLRGNKYGGTDKTATWKTCFLSTGEKPITTESSAGGAVNRIIEVDCDKKLVELGKETCDILNANYGHAGKIYIEEITKRLDDINKKYAVHYKSLEPALKTEKQTSIGAAILTAFDLSSKVLFDGRLELKFDEISKFLNDKATISQQARSYEKLFGFIACNANKFSGISNETYGKMKGDICFIDKTVFNSFCDTNNIDPESFSRWLSKNKKTITDKNRNTKRERINNVPTQCIAVILDEDNPFICED